MPFSACSAPDSRPSELVSLCCSLNSPVVSIPELPVGPAFAAIAIHGGSGGDFHATVAVRCQRTQEVIFFRAPSESGSRDGDCSRSALLWSERMGFLFDDEICTTDLGEAVGEAAGRNEKSVRNERAEEIWRELMQGAESNSVDPEFQSRPVELNAAPMLSKFRWEIDSWLDQRSARRLTSMVAVGVSVTS